MVLTHQRHGAIDAFSDEVAEGLGMALQPLDVGVVGQAIGRHGGLLSVGPGVRTVELEGRRITR